MRLIRHVLKDLLVSAVSGRGHGHCTRSIVSAMSGVALLLASTLAGAQSTDSPNGVAVTLPNGYANVLVDDMRVRSTAGPVRWMRMWDGQEWRFNPHWESLSQSWKNLTGSQSADTTGSTLTTSTTSSASAPPTLSASSSGGGDGCWVWVDEDWQPSVGSVMIGGIPEAGPLMPERSTPFNRLMGEASADYPPPIRVSVDYASLCAGAALSVSAVHDTEGIRRINELYLGDNGRYTFNNRSVLEKSSVKAFPPASAASLYGSLATGQVIVAPVASDKGFRWTDRGGEFIEYNTQGQVVAWGDRNGNVVWLVRDTAGIVRGVVDANGRVIYTLHYNDSLLVEVRDYPSADNPRDLPPRSVKYEYDTKNRLTKVTDVRGNVTRYDYDAQNRITAITDAEGRVERLAYNSDTVAKRTAPDDAVTEYFFEYDDVNKQFISKITGPETTAGRRTEDYTHNRSSKLVRRIINGQTDEEVRYDSGARAEISTNARGFSTRITRNEFEQPVQVDLPDGASLKFTYSALHLRMTSRVDEAGIKTEYQRDSLGNLLKKIDAVGTPDERVTEYELNSLGQPTKITRKGRTEINGTVTPDATWQLEFDGLGFVQKITDPEGGVRQYIVDRGGNTVSYTDPRGNTTRFDVDTAGNLVKITDPFGKVVSLVYDKVGNQLTYTDARGKAAQMAYDAMNRMTKYTNAVGGSYKVQYNGQGLPIQETDEDGRVSTLEFDNFLRLTKEVDAVGNKTEHSYQIPDGSQAGQLGTLLYPTEVKYPTFTQQTRYDERERPTSETLLNPNALGTEGLVSATGYDKRGLVKSETDANGKTSFYVYNAFGQRTEATDSLGAKTYAQYDARGNLLQVTDAKGNATRFEYDRNSRLTKEILPLGQAKTYQYDATGNLQRHVDPVGNKSLFEYDALNRVTKAQRYDTVGTLRRTTTYTWDAEGNLTAWSDTDHVRAETTSAALTYDDANRKTGETVTYPGGNTLGYGYTYSSAGLKTKLTWADGTNIDYGYSGHGELETVTLPGEGTISVNQFKWTAPTKVTLPGGTVQERSYDGLLNLESLKVKNAAQQTTLDLQNTYGKVQELKQSSRTDTVGGSSTTKNSSFTFDGETRLTQAQTDAGAFGTATENFTLDAVGNRIAHSQVSGAWTYDSNSRLIQRGTGVNATTYAYDDAGNLTQKTEPGNKVTRYAYDTRNRLVEVKDGSGNLIARYGYDPLNRRIWKEQYRDAQGNALATGKRTHYLYADEGLIAEATQDITLNPDLSVTANGSPHIDTQYGPTPDADFGTDVLFVKTKDSNGQDMVAYYHNDQLGAPVQATNKAGDVVWAASYNVFGQAQITTPAPTIDKPTIGSNLRLPGQYYDDETGLHYNYFRYYDPSTGRYTQEDPIGLEGGINRYVYASGNPLTGLDPYGLFDITNPADWPTLPQSWVDASAGFGDGMLSVVTLGLWDGDWVRDALGIGSVNSCSNAYGLGKITGEITATLILMRARNPCNSFTGETLVHVKPTDALLSEATVGRSSLKPISQLQVGDEVLAFNEWKERGIDARVDARLSYEKVVDIFTSFKEQTLVHLSLANGEHLVATEGHPFRTTEGWRDALMLKKGGKLLLKGGDAGSESPIEIADLRAERKILPVYNIEVANAHTYFVGIDGVGVHNQKCRLDKKFSDRGSNHKKNQTPSNVPKHQKAEERRGRDKGGEKGDKRRRY